MQISVFAFADLPPHLAYACWRLRQEVFVLEQACLYDDLDGRDPEPGTRHVLLTDGADDTRVVGYCRVLDDATGPSTGSGGVADSDAPGPSTGSGDVADSDAPRHTARRAWRIGRVVLAAEARGRGLSDGLVAAALEDCIARDAGRDVVLDAQSPLARWYAGFGFVVDGPEFIEDGIPHTPMRRRGQPLSRA